MVRVFSSRKAPGITSLVHPAKETPESEVRVVKLIEEYRGDAGKDGVDGADGRNAFPDGMVRLRLDYSATSTKRYLSKVVVEQSDLDDFAVNDALDFTSPIALPAGRRYRITVAGSPKSVFVPVGILIAHLDNGGDIREFLQTTITMPEFMVRLPAFSLIMYIEYMTEEGND